VRHTPGHSGNQGNLGPRFINVSFAVAMAVKNQKVVDPVKVSGRWRRTGRSSVLRPRDISGKSRDRSAPGIGPGQRIRKAQSRVNKKAGLISVRERVVIVPFRKIT